MSAAASKAVSKMNSLLEDVSNQNTFWMIILGVLLVICCFTSRPESFYAGGGPFIPAQPWIEYPENVGPNRGDRLYLGGSTKCFSCEKDLIKRGQPTYLGRPNKCFSCESQAVYQYGAKNGQFGQNNKCFDCESQYAPNPFKGQGELGGPRATPYCQKKSGGCDKQSVSRFGRADGQAYNDNLLDDQVGLVRGFGSADTNGMQEQREGDTMNPTTYPL